MVRCLLDYISRNGSRIFAYWRIFVGALEAPLGRAAVHVGAGCSGDVFRRKATSAQYRLCLAGASAAGAEAGR